MLKITRNFREITLYHGNNFRNDSCFVTGTRNGTVSLWKAKQVIKSAQIFNKWTLVFCKDDRIFAASKNNDVVGLNMSLNVVKKFKGQDSQPLSIDASQKYLIIGYENGHVDVHSLNELDQNGTHQKRMASNFL